MVKGAVEMKTLKQLLLKYVYPNDQDEIWAFHTDDVIDAVKEWLIQQQQEYRNVFRHSGELIIDELLEELNQQ